jgi:hypothetical protein
MLIPAKIGFLKTFSRLLINHASNPSNFILMILIDRTLTYKKILLRILQEIL